MRRVLATALVALCPLSAGVAHASEASEALSARGLIEMHEGRLEQARTLFQQAIDTDPNDLDARYYRAVVAGQLGDTAGAIADLRAVLAGRPSFDAAALELGNALTESGQYEEAIPWLEQAQHDPRLDGRASFGLGLAQLRLQRLDDARQSFQRARERDPAIAVASRYYEGVADYRAGNTLRAQESFTFVQETSPDSAIGQQAASYLTLLRRGRIGKYSLYASVALTYDSNVVLAPGNQTAATSVSNQADGAFNIDVGGIYIPWETDQFTLSIGYDFFQSLYFQLQDFDLQDHRPLAQLVWNPGPVEIGLLGRYDYYLLETSSLLEDITGLLWMGIPEEGFGRSEMSFHVRDRNAYQTDFRPLSGFSWAARVGQAVQLGSPEHVFIVGLQGDSDDTRDFKMHGMSCKNGNPPCGQYSYNGIQVEAGLAWRFTPTLDAEAGFLYRNEDYAQPSESFPNPGTFMPGPPRREDREYRAALSINQRLTDILWLNLAYLGTWNLSNKVDFQYNRQIGLVGVELRM